MNQLEEARIKINETDKAMAELFEKRMEAVKQVIGYKIENNLPIYDGAREAEVIERNMKNLKNSELKKYYRSYITALMGISKEYQKAILESSEKKTVYGDQD